MNLISQDFITILTKLNDIETDFETPANDFKSSVSTVYNTLKVSVK